MALSRGGSLAYIPVTSAGRQTLAWVDRGGQVTSFWEPRRRFQHPRISPNGRRLAVQGDGSLWVRDLARGTEVRLTGGMGVVWTPEGTLLAAGPEGIFRYGPNESTAVELILPSDYPLGATAWHPNGALLFYQLHPETARNILVLTPEDETRAVVQSPFDERAGVFSPNGRWLAYASNESGRYEVYVQSFPGGDARAAVSSRGGTEPMWSLDGRELFYRQGNAMMVVDLATDQGVEGVPQLLFESSFVADGFGPANYDVAPDGRFVMVQAVRSAAPPAVHVIAH